MAEARGSKSAVAFARLLPELSGDPSVLERAAKTAPGGGIKRALADVGAIVAAVRARRLDARLHVDLGEVRGFDYYTGVRFQAFVPGAPDAVLSGGAVRRSARTLRPQQPRRGVRRRRRCRGGRRRAPSSSPSSTSK